MIYNFQEQLKKGKSAEKILDNFFSDWFKIEEPYLSIEIEEKYDRLFYPLSDEVIQAPYKVEYKADFLALKTGNIFIETEIKYKTHSAPGWFYGTMADKIIYWIVGGEILIFDIETLRQINLDKLVRVSVKNTDWLGHGYLLPIYIAKQKAVNILEINYETSGNL